MFIAALAIDKMIVADFVVCQNMHSKNKVVNIIAKCSEWFAAVLCSSGYYKVCSECHLY